MDSAPRADKPGSPTWASLDPAAKHDRVLAAAELVFSEQGLGAPMPTVARAAGAGVGSLYRQFPSKEALVAALAVRRLTKLGTELDRALAEPDAWTGLEAFVWGAIGPNPGDEVSAEAIAAATGSPEVQEARREVAARMEQLVARAREQGAVRADATSLDLRLIIVGSRAVKHLDPGAWRRMAELAIDGLRRPPAA